MKSTIFKKSKKLVLLVCGSISLLSITFFAFSPKKSHSAADCRVSISYDMEVTTTKSVEGMDSKELSPVDQAQIGEFSSRCSVSNCIDAEGVSHSKVNNIEDERAFASGATDAKDMEFTDSEVYAKDEDGKMQTYKFIDEKDENLVQQHRENQGLVEALQGDRYSTYMLETLEKQGYSREGEDGSGVIFTKKEENGKMKTVVDEKTGQILSSELESREGANWKSTMRYEDKNSFLPTETVTEELTRSETGALIKTVTITKISNFRLEK